MPTTEIITDTDGKQWKIIVLPDNSGGETVLAVEVTTS